MVRKLNEAERIRTCKTCVYFSTKVHLIRSLIRLDVPRGTFPSQKITDAVQERLERTDINLISQKKLEAMMHTRVNEYQIWPDEVLLFIELFCHRHLTSFLTIKTRGATEAKKVKAEKWS